MTCRPLNLTIRWVREITTSLQILCPRLRVFTLDEKKNPESEWKRFNNLLSQTQCSDPRVKEILEYRLDYNEILK